MPVATTEARLQAYSGALLRRGAEQVVPLPFGFALRSPSVPSWWDLNTIVVERATAGLTAAGLEATADELQGDLPQRPLEIWDPSEVERLCPPGWIREPFALMAHGGPPPDPPAGVVETDRALLRPLRREWLAASELPPETLDEAAVAEERVFAVTAGRGFVALHGGAPIAMALLLDAGPVQQVEDVYVTPAHRGMGLGAAVVRTAVAAAYAAGAELVWLATEDGGRSTSLYERLGFRVAARATRCSRR